MSLSERWQGVAWIALSAAGFGAMAIFAKLAYRDGVSLSSMLFLRFAIAGLLLAVWTRMCGLHYPHGRNLAGIVAMGAIGYVGQAYCYFSALQHASAGVVALLLYLYPALVTLLSVILLRRHIGLGQGLAVAIALAGTALTVGGDLHSESAGIAFGIGAAVIYSAYILVGERLIPLVGSQQASTVVMLSAAVVYGLLAWHSGVALPTALTGWLAVLAIAIFSTLLAILGFFKGMEKLGAANAATLSTLEPLVTLGLAALVLGEVIMPVQMAGGVLILAAVIYLARHSTRA